MRAMLFCLFICLMMMLLFVCVCMFPFSSFRFVCVFFVGSQKVAIVTQKLSARSLLIRTVAFTPRSSPYMYPMLFSLFFNFLFLLLLLLGFNSKLFTNTLATNIQSHTTTTTVSHAFAPCTHTLSLIRARTHTTHTPHESKFQRRRRKARFFKSSTDKTNFARN